MRYVLCSLLYLSLWTFAILYKTRYMAKILNKVYPWFKLSHTYIVDIGEDNAERRMLYEGIVTRIDVSSDGTMSFFFTLSEDVTKERASGELKIYEDANAYKLGKTAEESYMNNVAGLINVIAINPNIFYIYTELTGEQYVAPRGFFINDNTMVEEIDFPETLSFTRTVDETGNISGWTSNANFEGLTDSEIYPSREEALKNHKTIIKRFSGKEDLI